MANKPLIADQLATRNNSLDFTVMGMLLPNPDPILRAQGKSISTYRDMRTDSHIGGCIRRRKAAVQALEWGLDRGKSSSRVAKSVQGMLDQLKLGRIISQMQNCTLYGYQPMEVVWDRKDGLYVPTGVLEKPPRWFCYDPENQLRLRTRSSPMLGELLPERKFLVPRQEPTYENPYGFADLSMCYWPLLFKKNSLKFWLAFTEKFGSAFSVGKLPRTASPEEHAKLLESLAALIQNGVATIPDDGSVDLVEMAGKGASADLYEKLVMHCRSDIAIALLGQNQTTEATANKASATAGLKVTDDLRDGDAEIIADTINELIEWICQVNFGDVERPVFSFWDQAAQDTLQAERDQSNYKAGARFTNAYWMRAYGYQDGDLQPDITDVQAKPQLALSSPQKTSVASFAENGAPTDTADPTQAQTDLLMRASVPVLGGMVDELQKLVSKASSPADLQRTIVQAYGDLDSSELVKLMAAAMAMAELMGIDAARSEA
jgi:phage gp29-like protein